MTSRRASPIVLALLTIVLTACGALKGVIGPWASADTVALVRQFLRADDQDAERLLPKLTGRSAKELEAALRRVLDDPPSRHAPTGMLPDQPIRVGDADFRYALYVPPSYTPAKLYPLIICLHGAGFGGDAYLDRWQPRLRETYILACPTIEGGAWWTKDAEALVLAVLAEVSRSYRIEPDRVFLSGMSNGGTGTFLIGLNHADRFAALIPMASALPRALYPLLENARFTRFYIIHGSRDQVMPVRYSRELISYLEEHGFQAEYREHDKEHPVAGGHFFPKEELPALVEWLAVRHRTPPPRQVTIVRDRDHLDRLYWVRIDDTRDTASFWASEHDHEESRRLEEGAFARLTAAIDGQTITVTTDRVGRYSLLLNRKVIELDRPIRVVTNGTTSFEGRVTLDAAKLLNEARRRPDPIWLAPAVIEIAVPSDSPPPPTQSPSQHPS